MWFLATMLATLFAGRNAAAQLVAQKPIGTKDTGTAQGPSTPEWMRNYALLRAAQPILELIGQHESKGSYNVVFGGKTYFLTSMTITQVYALQDAILRINKISTAAGKYQIIKKTLKAVVSQLSIDANKTYFNPTVQDHIALQILVNRGFDKFLSGRISKDSFAKALSMEWASMPKDRSNRTYYDDGINKALTTFNTVIAALEQSKQNYGVA